MAEEIGSAYLTIKPKMDDGFKSEAESSGGKSGTFFGNAFAVAAGELIAAGIAKIGSSMVDVFKSSFENYANFEQLTGGAKLLFGDAYDYIEKRSQEAYKNVQMSQNDYLQQVNGFSVGLKTALGGNEQAAAELADKIITAEADVVAATGATQENVQNAFNGIMKSNYSMLDNLQLGIAPTKAGMQEVIDKVNEWNAANGRASNYVIDNLADCQAALVDYIDMVGMSGYAQNEAADTIQGSLAMLTASWQNFTTSLMSDNADLNARTQELVDSIVVTVENIAPRLLAFAENLFAAVPELYEKLKPYIDEFIEMAGQFIEEHQPEIEAASEQMFDGIKQALGTATKLAVEALIDLIGELIRTFPEWYPRVQEAAFELFLEVVSGFANGLTPFMNEVNSLIQSGLDEVGSFFMDFFHAGQDIVDNIADGIGNVGNNIKRALEDPIGTAQWFIENAMNAIENIFDNLHLELPNIALPHFYVWGGEFPYGIGGMGYPPEFSIDWWAKGGFADEPTLNGYGERGLEFYWPSYAPYFDRYAQGIAEHMPARAGVDIHDCTFNVRKDSDIRAVAIELNTLINRQTAGGIA